jgi:hypothetical protein
MWVVSRPGRTGRLTALESEDGSVGRPGGGTWTADVHATQVPPFHRGSSNAALYSSPVRGVPVGRTGLGTLPIDHDRAARSEDHVGGMEVVVDEQLARLGAG